MKRSSAANRAKWELIEGEYLSSGQRQKAFCLERGYNYFTFKNWHQKFRDERHLATEPVESGSTFREVTRVKNCRTYAPNQELYTIVLKNERRLQVNGDFSEAIIGKLIEVLERC